ncbi:hypothetical protein [Aquihabitans sp. McL0605]|uniref:hypothetical protein n=1 Tax=Aquihabitans sp. McL0605 TaxID=3415671 RepID=UPI003CEAD1E0
MSWSTPSAPDASSARPPLAAIAESIHHGTADDPVARLVFVRFEPSESLSLGFWDLPPCGGHPLEPLVGFVAPRSWDALGVVTSGRLHALDAPRSAPRPVVSTVLAHRDGSVASVIDGDAGSLQVIEDPPVGLVPDVLARALGRPTPAPDHAVSAFVDATWLDRLAAGLLARPSHGRAWRWLADRHPLRGGGPVPAPEELAARVAAYAQHRSWADLREQHTETPLPAATLGPPDGTVLAAGAWFDDGSLSRWSMRHLPPPEALVPDLLAVLPADTGAALLTALGGDCAAWAS